MDRRFCAQAVGRDGPSYVDAAKASGSTPTSSEAAYLRTVQDWIVRPQIKGVPGVAGVDSIGGYVKQYQVSPIRRN